MDRALSQLLPEPRDAYARHDTAGAHERDRYSLFSLVEEERIVVEKILLWRKSSNFSHILGAFFLVLATLSSSSGGPD
jgi:hypothetical protein